MERLFSTKDYIVTEDEKKEYIKMLEDDGELDNRDITDDEIYDYYNMMLEDDLIDLLKNNKFEDIILIGKIQVWNGTYTGVKYISNDDSLKTLISNYDNCSFYKEDRKLFLYLYHHDGTHILEVKRLNKKGIEKIDNLYNKSISIDEHFLEHLEEYEKKYTINFFKSKKEYFN